MDYAKFFETEIAAIQDYELQDFCRYYFNNCVPAYFWRIGASSSGRFHPKFSQGLGGLVRHTKAAMRVLEDLLRMSTWGFMPDFYKDYARVALLCHDTAKYGVMQDPDKNEYVNHGRKAAKNVSIAWEDFFNAPAPALLSMAIVSHMGQWVEDRDDRPFTPIDRVVHMADYVASRNYIDIPEISEEWEKTASELFNKEER